MKISQFLLITAATLFSSASFSGQNCSELLDHQVRKLGSSEQINLCEEYAGKVLLVVNTASRCVFTPQYEGLEKMHQRYGGRGLVVLGFPSNDFANQEPGSDKKIASFCRVNYGVSFPMFSKISVKGGDAHPFYAALRQASGSTPRWNFHKYLIGRDGKVIDSYASWTAPDSDTLLQDIEKAL